MPEGKGYVMSAFLHIIIYTALPRNPYESVSAYFGSFYRKTGSYLGPQKLLNRKGGAKRSNKICCRAATQDYMLWRSRIVGKVF